MTYTLPVSATAALALLLSAAPGHADDREGRIRKENTKKANDQNKAASDNRRGAGVRQRRGSAPGGVWTSDPKRSSTNSKPRCHKWEDLWACNRRIRTEARRGQKTEPRRRSRRRTQPTKTRPRALTPKEIEARRIEDNIRANRRIRIQRRDERIRRDARMKKIETEMERSQLARKAKARKPPTPTTRSGDWENRARILPNQRQRIKGYRIRGKSKLIGIRCYVYISETYAWKAKLKPRLEVFFQPCKAATVADFGDTGAPVPAPDAVAHPGLARVETQPALVYDKKLTTLKWPEKIEWQSAKKLPRRVFWPIANHRGQILMH